MPALPQTVPCAHCGLNTQVAASHEGDAFCCAGCEAVASLLRDEGWDAFYARREGYSPRPQATEVSVFDGERFLRQHGQPLPNGKQRVRIRVGGVRCAACVWLNERALNTLDGVEAAAVSHGTNIATIDFDPTKQTPSRFADQIAQLGYTPLTPSTPERATREELVRLGVAAFCAMNVMFMHIAIYFGAAQGMQPRHAKLFTWGALLLATPSVMFSARPFFRNSAAALRQGVVSMDVPIALAIGVMYAQGISAVFTSNEAYLDSLVMLIAFLLGGRVLVASGRSRASQAAESVLASAPETVDIERGGRIVATDVDQLQPGDVWVAGPGSRAGADGVVLEGTAEVDLAHITGEADTVALAKGDVVPAGASVRAGQMRVEISRPASASTIANIERWVQEALSSRAHVDALDRVAPKFTAAVLFVALTAAAVWWFRADEATALEVMVAVLVVACPCALALAAPTTFAVAIGAAAKAGAFVRDGNSLLALTEVTQAAFDKTGTLTEGRPQVVSADDDVLVWAAAVEVGNRHPVARALVHEVEVRGLPTRRAYEVTADLSGGVQGRVDGRAVAVVPVGPGRLRVNIAGEVVGEIVLRDVIRDDAAESLAALALPVTVLSGDHPEAVTRWLSPVQHALKTHGGNGQLLALRGGLKPHDKATWVDAQAQPTLFVGDGLNDAPALASAHVGVAMGSGADAAIQTADIVILTPSLGPLIAARQLGQVVTKVLRQNRRFALAYNVVAVGLACAGWITPLWAAVLMPLSSGAVVLNALSVPMRVRRRQAARTIAPPLPTAPALSWMS